MPDCDLCIVGGGAAGLIAGVLAAQAAKERELPCRILILEKEREVGLKLKNAGAGRANLSHVEMESSNYYSDDPIALGRLLQEYDPEAFWRFVNSLGLVLYEDEGGRSYPLAEEAKAYRDLLLAYLKANQVRILCQTPVVRIAPVPGAQSSNQGSAQTPNPGRGQNPPQGSIPASASSTASSTASSGRVVSMHPQSPGLGPSYQVFLGGGRMVRCRALILATGSPAAPNLGGSLASERFLQDLGLGEDLVPYQPALVPLCLEKNQFCHFATGSRFKGNMTLLADQRIVGSRSGEFLFTSYGLSGIASMEAASLMAYIRANRALAGQAPSKSWQALVDFFPGLTADDLYRLLERRWLDFPGESFDLLLLGLIKMKMVKGLLADLLSDRLGDQRPALVQAFSRRQEALPHGLQDLSAQDLQDLASLLKAYPFHIIGDTGFQNAQTALGGLMLDALDEDFCPKDCPGLYLAGELLYVTGNCGGFNLHFAFASAAKAVANAFQALYPGQSE